MIKVDYHQRKEIINLYRDRVIPMINKKRMCKCKSSSLFCDLSENLRVADQKVVTDILFEEREVLETKYSWIQEYLKLCDFVANYKYFRENIKFRWEYKKKRAQYINDYNGVYLKKIIIGLGKNEQYYSESDKKFGELLKKAKAELEEANQIVKKMFDYAMLSPDTRHLLVKKMDVTVCPYCNRQYIQSLILKEGEDAVYLGDLDHIYPKDIYQLFSMSIWNLVPCCKACNQIFKKQKNRPFLHPTKRGFEDNCVYKIEFEDVRSITGNGMNFHGSWKLETEVNADIKEKITNNIEMFRLNSQYEIHKEDVRDILRKRTIYSNGYLTEMMNKLKISGISKSEINRLLYGVSLDKEKFTKEILSKMTYDIINHND